MKIFHTADWHIGQHLHTKKRYEEFNQFFCWLIEKISAESVDVLLVAGDVFDSTTPSNYALELYNNFLAEVSKTSCRHVVITGGNHDSPSLLNAQRQVLKLLQIHVVGGSEKSAKDEVLVLRNQNNIPELIVCAVPYLRDRDVRKSEPGETIEIKGQKLIEGIRLHYEEVCSEAIKIRDSLGHWVPIIGMGHLFAAGGITKEGDGVRDLYVGSLGHVHADLFPESFDYLALGHLHVPQIVGGKETIRYSGSPLPISFSEAEQIKKLISIEFVDRQIQINEMPIPCFHELKRIRGDWPEIFEEIGLARDREKGAYLEIVYSGGEFIDPKTISELHSSVEGSNLQILKINNERKRERIISEGKNSVSLDELQPIDVFRSVLQIEGVPEPTYQNLIPKFLEIVQQVEETDLLGVNL
jgi:exonuclease SbcD